LPVRQNADSCEADQRSPLKPITILQAAYDHILEQFAPALIIGAHENSSRSDGKLVIDANHGNIHLLQTAFYAVKLEVRRRNPACC
jgi:hypothetical protein